MCERSHTTGNIHALLCLSLSIRYIFYENPVYTHVALHSASPIAFQYLTLKSDYVQHFLIIDTRSTSVYRVTKPYIDMVSIYVSNQPLLHTCSIQEDLGFNRSFN